MSTFTAVAYHIVFSTKDRAPVLLRPDGRSDLFRYIRGIIENRDGHLYRINGVKDHLHILTSLHPTVSLADFVKDIKTGSARWIKQNRVFPGLSQAGGLQRVYLFEAGFAGPYRVHQTTTGAPPQDDLRRGILQTAG